MDDFEACIAHLRFPVTHRRAIRTTNLFERLFVEERRRLKIIPNAFGERAVLKLRFGALIRAPSDGVWSKSPSSNVASWLLSENNSIRNTGPRSTSMHSLQRMQAPSKYPAVLGLDLSVW
jgi:transposase-like protein